MLLRLWGTASCLLPVALALRQPYDYLVALQEFQEGWLDPGPIVQKGEAPILADDVIGRVDVTTTFVGNQLNTEYLYGLWLGITESNTTSLIGSPVNQTLQTLLIEPPEVFFSTITDLSYPTIDTTLPLQIDSIFRFNDDLKIESYDITFRRWPEAFKYLLPTLAPQLAKELGKEYNSSTNTTHLLAQKVANDVCIVAEQYCVGNNTQYSGYNDCYNFIANEIPFGDLWEGGLNTGFCRYIHKNMVQYRPDVHCAHIGPSGGDMCIDRDYDEIVNTFPFNSTLQAPSASLTPGDFDGLSANSVNQLTQEALNLAFPTTVSFYPLPAMVLFVILYLSTKLVEKVLWIKSVTYQTMSTRNQRNTVNYFINTFYTTVALGLQLPAVATLGGVFSFGAIQALKISAVLVTELYVWELAYRLAMRPSLIAHHFCTLLAIFALFIALENTWHPNLVPAGVIWLFQATTEQTIFIGMFMYRLNFNRTWTRRMLKFGAIQSFFVKFVFAIVLLAWWGAKLVKYNKVGTDIFFSVILVTMLVGLMATQVYGSWAVWCIGKKLNGPPRGNVNGSSELEKGEASARPSVSPSETSMAGSSTRLTSAPTRPPRLPELRLGSYRLGGELEDTDDF